MISQVLRLLYQLLQYIILVHWCQQNIMSWLAQNNTSTINSSGSRVCNDTVSGHKVTTFAINDIIDHIMWHHLPLNDIICHKWHHGMPPAVSHSYCIPGHFFIWIFWVILCAIFVWLDFFAGHFCRTFPWNALCIFYRLICFNMDPYGFSSF